MKNLKVLIKKSSYIVLGAAFCFPAIAMEKDNSFGKSVKFEQAVELLKTAHNDDKSNFECLRNDAKQILQNGAKQNHEPSKYLLSIPSLFLKGKLSTQRIENSHDRFMSPGTEYVFPERTELFDSIRLEMPGSLEGLATFNPRSFVNERYIVHLDSKKVEEKLAHCGDDWISALALVFENKKIGELAFNTSPDKISKHVPIFLEKMLQKSPMIISLCFSSSSINNQTGLALANSLKKMENLQELNLCRNTLSKDTISDLLEAVAGHKSLRNLCITENMLDNTDAKKIAKMLERNSSLQGLNLFKNNIGDEGAIAIANALRVNQTLKSISLSDNPIGPEGIEQIIRVIEVNSNIKMCDFSGLTINQQSLKNYFNNFKRESSMKILASPSVSFSDLEAKFHKFTKLSSELMCELEEVPGFKDFVAESEEFEEQEKNLKIEFQDFLEDKADLKIFYEISK